MYHREDLRAELLAAARAFIAENGHEGLSVRALAVGVGVSPGAPYHHFPDRRALLLAIAADAFESFNAAAAAIMAATLGPFGRLRAMGESILDFQAANPNMLALMYESELTRPVMEPALREAQWVGFGHLTEAIRGAVPDLTEPALRARTIAFWSTIYGFTSLMSKHLLDPYLPGEQTSDEVRRAVIAHAIGPQAEIVDR